MKNISVIGSGYVGLVTGTCLAEIGHKVICIDSNKEKIKKLQSNILPIYEPGLGKLITKNKKAKRLFFSSSIKKAVKNSEIIFIAVHTPPKDNGEADLYYVESVKKAEKIMRELYKPIKAPFIVTNIKTAEIIKHSCNSFLATKISFINAVANLCEKLGIDIEDVVRAMELDKRIGSAFLKAGIGYGGSCFPKDVDAFVHIAAQNEYNFDLLKIVQKINQQQKDSFVKKIKKALWNLRDKKLGVLGLAFKPNTDDMRNAPSVEIINTLIKEGALIKAYDPVATNKAKEIFKEKISYCSNLYEAAKGSDTLIIFTEWEEFRKMDLERVKKLLKTKIIIDGRNIFNPSKMRNLGFKYICMGRE